MSTAVADAINAQIGRELQAELEYLSICSHFDAEGLPELARFFRAQAAEEHDHAMRFLDYLLESGGPVRLPAIAAPRHAFESAHEAVALSLDWERRVTAHIHDLMELAIAERDHAAQAMLQWFVTEQVEEVANMDELLRVVDRAGEAGLLQVEDYLHRRATSGSADPA